jgi:hypothetical protein
VRKEVRAALAGGASWSGSEIGRSIQAREARCIGEESSA